MGFIGVLLRFLELIQNQPNSIGFYRVSEGIYWVLLGFTGRARLHCFFLLFVGGFVLLLLGRTWGRAGSNRTFSGFTGVFFIVSIFIDYDSILSSTDRPVVGR